MTHSRLAGLTVAVLIATSAFLISTQVKHGAQARTIQQHNLTDVQIADRAREVFARLDPAADHLDMIVRPIRMSGFDGAIRGRWVVDCSEVSGKPVGSGIWDGDTGVPCSIVPAQMPEVRLTGPTISRAAAIQAARPWLPLMADDATNVAWRPARKPAATRCNWLTYWRAPGWSAVVTTDRHTGGLVSIHSWLSSGWTPTEDGGASRRGSNVAASAAPSAGAAGTQEPLKAHPTPF